MSEQHPPTGDPSYAADQPWDTGDDRQRSGRGRRTALVTAVSVAVVAVLGGGAIAAVQLFGGGGPQPAEALPASTVALLTVDLDPSAKQKIEAIRTLRKFPGLKKQLGLGERDDLRRYVFDKATESGGCKSLSYARDIKPWVGDRVAIAAVDLGSRTPAPVVALQVSDVDKAKAGIAKIAACGHPGKDFGYAVANDYLLVSDSSAHAATIAAEAQRHPLSDDASYQKWSTAAGDAGVVNFYVAKRAAQLVAANLDRLPPFFPLLGGTDGLSSSPGGTELYQDPSGMPSGFPTRLPTDLPTGTATANANPAAYHPPAAGDPQAPLKKALASFQGLGGAVRFADGGIEIEVASGGAVNRLTSGGRIGGAVGRLPKDTAVAVGFGVPKDYAKTAARSLSHLMGASTLTAAEAQLGITLPDDLQTLLGSALTFSVGGDAPDDLSSISGPADMPLALSVTGDPAAIKGVIAKIEKRTGHGLADAQLVTRSSSDTFTVATNGRYADQVQQHGGLGDSDTFTGVVPHADKASSIVYVNFDSGWVKAIARQSGGSGSDSVGANLAPLKALGMSSWSDGGIAHGLVKLTTD